MPIFCVFYVLQLKLNKNRCAFSDLTLKPDRTAEISCRVLYDRQPKPGTAGFLGMTLVYTVEAFKDTVLMLGRDTNAGIAD